MLKHLRENEMNKKIKELAEQAEEYIEVPMPNEIYNLGDGVFRRHKTFNREKFAELIVREMLVTCEEHPAWTGRMIGEQIKQHFGVEDGNV